MQQTHKKDFGHTLDFPFWLKFICNVSNLTQDLEQSIKILLKFGGAKESQIFFVPQKNLVHNLEIYSLMVLVIVTLLSLQFVLYSSLGSSNLKDNAHQFRINIKMVLFWFDSLPLK